MSHWITRTLITAACWFLGISLAHAAPPYTVEEMLSPPYPYGVSIRGVAISDEAAYIAGAWDDTDFGNRDLWTYDVAADTWTQRTWLWPEKEARLRREFERDLGKDRLKWEEEQAADDDETAAGESGESEGDQQVERLKADYDNPAGDAAPADIDDNNDDEDEAAEFDEAERIEDFEKDLAKQRKAFGGIGQIVFRQHSHEVFWTFEGRIYSLDLDDPGAEPRLRLEHANGFSISDVPRNGDNFLLASGSEMYLWWPVNGTLRALTQGGTGDRSNVGSGALSPDQHFLATVVRDYSAVRQTIIPELLADDPYTTPRHYSRPGDTPETVRLKLFDLSAEPSWTIEVELTDEPYYQVQACDWSPIAGDNRLLLGVITGDTQHYRAYIITPPVDDVSEAEIELIYHEHDDKWINWARTKVTWDNQAGLLLHSEKDGIAGLYRLAAREIAEPEDTSEPEEPEGPEESEGPEDEPGTDAEDEPEIDYGTHEAVPLYLTEYEVAEVRPLQHSAQVVLFLYFPDHTAQAIGLYDLVDGTFNVMTPEPARRSGFAINEQETVLSFTLTTERHFGELAMLELKATAPAERVIKPRDYPQWQAWADGWDQRFIDVPVSADMNNERIYREGELITAGSIPVKLWLPPGWTEDGTYPLLIWIHGAGYSQTVTRDPGFYTLFHPWVAEERGWLVAEVEYRGSEGLGRDWRVDVWGRLGHPETDDLLAVKRAMVADWSADPQRTALWGWSYGGFQTLMALGLAPGEFPVGCAVAPVNDWRNYNYWYSTGRLGNPADNEDEYDRSAAETYLENITDDLLIIHGLQDDNTLFQSIAQYLEKGHELGINVELKLFPSDSHGIGNEQHYVRIYDAILDYCEAHWPEG